MKFCLVSRNNSCKNRRVSRVPTRRWKYWKSTEFQKCFKAFKKYWNLAKMYIRYWKSMEIL